VTKEIKETSINFIEKQLDSLSEKRTEQIKNKRELDKKIIQLNEELLVNN
jgi:hypothetical protein